MDELDFFYLTNLRSDARLFIVRASLWADGVKGPKRRDCQTARGCGGIAARPGLVAGDGVEVHSVDFSQSDFSGILSRPFHL